MPYINQRWLGGTLTNWKTIKERINELKSLETRRDSGDFERLSYGLYYAEITRAFADGLEHDSATYFDYLASSVHLQARKAADAVWLCMEFEMGLLDFLGYTPELTCCLGFGSSLMNIRNCGSAQAIWRHSLRTHGSQSCRQRSRSSLNQ